MKFTLAINCDNAAFDDSPEAEVRRILLQTAEQVEEYGDITCRNVRDLNGNRVGYWAFEEV